MAVANQEEAELLGSSSSWLFLGSDLAGDGWSDRSTGCLLTRSSFRGQPEVLAMLPHETGLACDSSHGASLTQAAFIAS